MRKISTEAFVAAWQAAGSLDDVAAATGLARTYVSQRASHLRARGRVLKKFCERAQLPEPSSARAAQEAREQRLTFREAASRNGVTHQAVQQAYARLYPDEAPPVGSVGDAFARATVVELARSGKSDAAVAAEVGFSAAYVGKIRRGAGIDRAREKNAEMRAAVDEVRRGARTSHAAADHGVSYGGLSRRCREAGVALAGIGCRDGSAVAAADLVERTGVAVSAAARTTRCAPPAVRDVLARRRRRRA